MFCVFLRYDSDDVACQPFGSSLRLCVQWERNEKHSNHMKLNDFLVTSMAWIGCQRRASARSPGEKPPEQGQVKAPRQQPSKMPELPSNDNPNSVRSADPSPLSNAHGSTEMPPHTQGMKPQTQVGDAQNCRLLHKHISPDFFSFLDSIHDSQVSWRMKLNNHNQSRIENGKGDKVNGFIKDCMECHVTGTGHRVYLTLPYSVEVGDKLEVQGTGFGTSKEQAIETACRSAFAVLLLNHPYDVKLFENKAWKCPIWLIRAKANNERQQLKWKLRLAEEDKSNVEATRSSNAHDSYRSQETNASIRAPAGAAATKRESAQRFPTLLEPERREAWQCVSSAAPTPWFKPRQRVQSPTHVATSIGVQATGSQWCSLGVACAIAQFLRSHKNECLYRPSPFDWLASTPWIVADCMQNNFRHLFAEEKPYQRYQAEISRFTTNSMFMHVKNDLPKHRARLQEFKEFLQEPKLYKRFVIATTSDHNIPIRKQQWECEVRYLFHAMLAYPITNFTLLAVFTKPSLTEDPASSLGWIRDDHDEHTSRLDQSDSNSNAHLRFASLQLQGRVKGSRLTNQHDATALLAILRENSGHNAEFLRTNATTPHRLDARSDASVPRGQYATPPGLTPITTSLPPGLTPNTSRMAGFAAASPERKLPATCSAIWPFAGDLYGARVDSDFIRKMKASQAAYWIQWLVHSRKRSCGFVGPEALFGFTREIYKYGNNGFQAVSARYKMLALKVHPDKSSNISDSVMTALTTAVSEIKEAFESLPTTNTFQY